MQITWRRPGARRTRHAANGQALAEFAVAAIPLLLMLLGILQFALLYNAQIGLTNGVRDAARYGSTLVANTDATAASSATATRSFLGTSLADHVVPYNAGNLAAQVCYAPASDPTLPVEVRVRVTATYGHPLVVPLISLIIDAADGTPDGLYSITSTIELRVDNPPEPPLNVTGSQCQT
ncbi:MAG TPA: TadE/TadG family type IV pilus assembly protein [Candidatus Limnocylindrales bacterium]|nr:TadE/TadG family type IV pilus assembly protein [Candidatus Limnocylindrales bacterium]